MKQPAKSMSPGAAWSGLARAAALCVLCVLNAGESLGQPPYGELEAVEYGNALYRFMGGWGSIFVGDYNHTGLFAGLRQSDGAPRVLEVIGMDQPNDTTVDVDFIQAFKSYNEKYYGAYELSDAPLTFEDRKAIVTTARSLTDAAIPFSTFLALDYKGSTFDGTIEDIEGIRCDGFVEYCFEANGRTVWWNTGHPNQWSIASFPDPHNVIPSLFSRDPAHELTPWSQRGAPGHSPDPQNTRMTKPAVISPPACEVTQVTGGGWADVTIRAVDESGIHRIAVKPPGASDWQFSPRQPQHPWSDSFSYTVRVAQEGLFRYYALDNGGNQSSEQAVFILFVERNAAQPSWRLYQ